MSAVKPPEWDAMSAKEQLLWYLERLCTRAEEMSSVLGIARVGDPPTVTSLVDPAASTTTHASSAPVPDVSCSTAKAQEVLEVTHDVPPASITMAHVICSTKCSHQVTTTDIVNEVCDATAAIFPVPAVAFQPALDTTVHVAKGLGPDPDDSNAELSHTVTPTEISPELASLEVCGIRHGVVAVNINIPTAPAFTGSPVWPGSNFDTPESSLPSTHKDAHQVFEPMPRLFDKPEAAADVKEHKDDAKLSVITFVLNSPAWYDHFSPRDNCFVPLDAHLVIEEHMRSELCLTWPPLVGINFSELCSSGQFDSDRTLSLFPWNPGGYLLKHRNQMTMMLITAGSGSHWLVTGVTEESGLCFSPIAKIQCLFPICLKTMTQCLLVKLRRLQVFLVSSVELQPWPSWNFSLTVLPILKGVQVLLESSNLIVTLVDLQPWPSWGFTSCASTRADARMCSRISGTNCGATQAVPGLLNLSLIAWSRTQRLSTGSKQKPCTARGNYWAIVLPSLNCLFENCIRLLPGQQRLSELCACSFTTALKLQYPYLATMDAHLVHSRQKTGALSTKLSSSIFLQFMQLGPHELGCCIIFFVQSSYDICARDVQLRFGLISQKHVQPKPPYSSGDCRTVRVWSELFKTELSDKFCSSVTKLCWLAVTSTHDLGSVEYIEHLFLFIHEQSRRFDTTGNLVCKTQEHRNLSEQHILERAAVCSVPMGNKLQRKIQLISLSVHQKKLSQEDCKCVLLMLLSNEEAATSTVIQSMNSRFNGFASSWSMIPPAHEFSYMMSCATTVKWVAQFGAVLLGKLPCISFYLPSAQPKHPWPFPVATMCTQQLLFPMKTITGFVTILKIYSRLFEFGIAHLLGSKSASARHLEQSWDPGASDKTLPVQVSHPWEGITHCRIMFHDGQRVVDSMQFSSGCKQERFQGGNGPGFVSSSHLQPLTILVVKIISKGAPAISGMTFSTGYNQDHFQEGRGIIVVAAVFTPGFVDHRYDLGFDHDGADNGYVLDGNSIHHNCCFNLVDVYSNFDYHQDSNYVHEHRVHWDLGGYQWCRLGVKPSFKKGGMLGALGPACVHGLPYDSTWARPGCAPP